MIRKFLNILCMLCAMIMGINFAYAEETKKISIVTYDSFAAEWGIGPSLKEQFEKTCACMVEYKVFSSSLGMIAALKSGSLKDDDILLGFDQITYQRNPFIRDYLSAHTLQPSAIFADTHVYPYDFGTVALVTRKGVFEKVPDSWEELAKNAKDHSIALIDPRSSTVGQAMLLDMAIQFGDNLDDFLKKLKPKILTVSQGWGTAYALFTEEEAQTVLSYTTSPSYHRIIEKDDKKIALINKKGHVRQIELMGVLKNSQHKNLAINFYKVFFLKKSTKPYPHIAMDVSCAPRCSATKAIYYSPRASLP